MGKLAKSVVYAFLISKRTFLIIVGIALIVAWILREMPLIGLESTLLLICLLYGVLILSIAVYMHIVSLYYTISKEETKLKEISRNISPIFIIITIIITIIATAIYLTFPSKSWRALNILGILYTLSLVSLLAYLIGRKLGYSKYS